MSQAEEPLPGPTPGSALSAHERQQLQRMLSDPTVFPLPYKTWLISYLEASDFNLPLSSVVGLRKELDKLSVVLTALEARMAVLERDTP